MTAGGEVVPGTGCPRCFAGLPALSIGRQLAASASNQAGVVVVSARSVPVLHCGRCGLRLAGEYDDTGHHATFPWSPGMGDV